MAKRKRPHTKPRKPTQEGLTMELEEARSTVSDILRRHPRLVGNPQNISCNYEQATVNISCYTVCPIT